jgi:hypothetical protein
MKHNPEKRWTTRAVAQRTANRLNDYYRDVFYVVGCDERGWYIEDLNALETVDQPARLRQREV